MLKGYRKLRDYRGYSLLEILAAITILSLLAAFTVQHINASAYIAADIADQFMTAYSDISISLNNYQNAKNASPTGLSDPTFAQYYIYPPVAPTGFDTTYGVTGFNLAYQTGQPSPNNGWYVCSKVTVTGANDARFQALKLIATKLSSKRFSYNTSCPSISNASDPTGTTTLFATNWIDNE